MMGITGELGKMLYGEPGRGEVAGRGRCEESWAGQGQSDRGDASAGRGSGHAVDEVTALRQTLAQVEAASAAKTEFLVTMSHELRAPLQAILGFAQLIEYDQREPLPDRQLERLRQIMRGGEHLQRLLNDALDLSRIEARRVAIALAPVDVAGVVNEAVATLSGMAARADIALGAAALPAGVPWIVADRMRVLQVLINLGTNAIKYGRRGGHVELRVEPRGETVRILVVDDGVGVPEDRRAELFEPFQRAGQEQGEIEGTGIGLTICKRLVELMDGAIGFSSVAGRGSEFWIALPVARP